MEHEDLMNEVRSILAPRDQEPAENLADPLVVGRNLKAAKEHLVRAHAGMRMLHERGIVPSGIVGTDGVRAGELAEEVDKLSESVANYYE